MHTQAGKRGERQLRLPRIEKQRQAFARQQLAPLPETIGLGSGTGFDLALEGLDLRCQSQHFRALGSKGVRLGIDMARIHLL
jgi:hypothetical protein